jgi:arylsulfatase A-like enzyme
MNQETIEPRTSDAAGGRISLARGMSSVAGLWSAASLLCTAAEAKQPNVLFLLADDHTVQALSCYDGRYSELFQTPNLDRLANEGVRFENCFAVNSICTPSRAAILTGLRGVRSGVRTLACGLDPSIPTYPGRFQAAGYQTAVLGKWHLYTEPQGFDYFAVTPKQGDYFDPKFIVKGTSYPPFRKNVSMFALEPEKEAVELKKGHNTDVVTDLALEWLEERDASKPFLLEVHYKACHAPFNQYPDRYADLLEDVTLPYPESWWEDKSHRSEASRLYGIQFRYPHPLRQGKMKDGVWHLPELNEELHEKRSQGITRPRHAAEADYQQTVKGYLRLTRGIDDSVGRLLEHLEQEGLLENTIIVYSADQGFFLGEHDYRDKRWIWEDSIRMPLMIRYPRKIPAGTVADEQVTNLDFAPTLLDLAGLPPMKDLDGVSFAELAAGGEEPVRDAVYYRYWMHMAHHGVPAHYGIRTPEYKLVFFYGLPLDAEGALDGPTPAGWELYDLKRDPAEMRNIYDNPEYAGVIQQLKKQLAELKQEVGDTDEQYPELLKRLAETP